MERERGKENFKSWSSDKMWTWAEQRKKKKKTGLAEILAHRLPDPATDQ